MQCTVLIQYPLATMGLRILATNILLFLSSSVEEESKDCEVHGLNQQATWMFEMLYGKTRKDDDAANRRESLTNIEGIASRISSLHDKENTENNNNNNKKTPIEIKAAASVRVRS